MDVSLNQTCTLAKLNHVIVYGLAVDAPPNGQAVIAACASSQAHYFEATPEGIVNAFQTIASNITMLKLAQQHGRAGTLDCTSPPHDTANRRDSAK